jgi:ribosomal protein S6--L-glutamate ligase
VTVADPGTCELGPGYGGRLLRISGETALGFDLCVPRLSRTWLDHTLRLCRALNESGTLLLNDLDGRAAARDKFEAYRALRKADLPTPDTTLVADPDHVEQAAASVGGFPVVAKPLRCSQGSGVSLHNDAESARVWVMHMKHADEPVLFQSYVRGANFDVRLVTVGARVLGAMRRTGAEGDFRSNLHQGGSASSFNAPEPLRDLAQRVANVFGLRFSGIDVIFDNGSPRILEVNASPGFEGFQKATGIDVAEAVVAHSERMMSAR